MNAQYQSTSKKGPLVTMTSAKTLVACDMYEFAYVLHAYVCNSESTEWSSCTRYSSDLHIHSEGGCPSLFLGMNKGGGGLRGDAHFLQSSLLQLQHHASLRALEDGHRLSVEDAHHGVVVHLVGRGQAEKGEGSGCVSEEVRTYVCTICAPVGEGRTALP